LLLDAEQMYRGDICWGKHAFISFMFTSRKLSPEGLLDCERISKRMLG